MNTLPAISILIPVYNVEPYVARCVKSVMAQTYAGDIECIVVDDCGTDKSMVIVEKLLADYRGSIDFHILRHTHNRGLAAARNTAVDASRGTFVVHIDSDDWIEPVMIENLVARQLETKADIVSCNGIAHFAERDILLEEPSYSSKEEMMRSIFKLTLNHVIWRRLIRTSLYKDNAIMAYEGHNIGEDHYTLPRLLFFAKSFATCKEVLYHYNCLNEKSYLQSHQALFNFRKYRDDRDAIDILLAFFTQYDDSYIDDLYREKAMLVYKSFSPAIQTHNREAYEQLCSDWKSIDKRYKHISALQNFMLTFSYDLSWLFISARKCIRRIKCW